MKYKELPSIEILKAQLTYDKETGNLYKKGKIARINGRGYREVYIKGKIYLAHRIIWKMCTGEDPGDNLVDHKNMQKLDNRISNLRLANHAVNNKNRLGTGITKLKDKKRKKPWLAQITVNYVSIKQQHECPLMARLWYLDKKAELHECGTQVA